MKRTGIQRISCWLAVLLLTGCAATRHGWTQSAFEGFVVPVQSRPGMMRLQIERDFDPGVEAYVSKHGEPDYLYVIDRRTLKLIYMQPDRVVTFKRPFLSGTGSAAETNGLPGDLIARLNDLHPALHSLSNAAPEESP